MMLNMTMMIMIVIMMLIIGSLLVGHLVPHCSVIAMHLIVTFHDLDQKLQLNNDKLRAQVDVCPQSNRQNADAPGVGKSVKWIMQGGETITHSKRLHAELKPKVKIKRAQKSIFFSIKKIPHKPNLQLEGNVAISAGSLDEFRI